MDRNQRLWLIRVVGVAGGGGSAESGRRGAPHPRWYCCCEKFENGSTLARNQRLAHRNKEMHGMGCANTENLKPSLHISIFLSALL